jgi:Kef-type K+ transport system membrane component KefB
MDRAASLRMGVGMISRGEVGLIVAGVGVSEGILEPQLFSVIILMVLITTLVTPPLLRWTFVREEAEDAAASRASTA